MCHATAEITRDVSTLQLPVKTAVACISPCAMISKNAGDNILRCTLQQLCVIRLLTVDLHVPAMYAVNLHAQHIKNEICIMLLLACLNKASNIILTLQGLAAMCMCIHIKPVCLNACLTLSARCP